MVHAIFYSGFICTVTSKVFHFHDEFEVFWIGAEGICSVQCYIFLVFVLSAIIVWIIQIGEMQMGAGMHGTLWL